MGVKRLEDDLQWRRDNAQRTVDLKEMLNAKCEIGPQDLAFVKSNITWLITSSPSVVCPSTETVDAVVESVRTHLGNIEPTILLDGIHAMQEFFSESYAEYKHRLQSKYRCVAFDRFMHQAGMLRAVLGQIETPLVFFTEHDLPLRPRPIDWTAICKTLLDRQMDCIRFCIDDERKENLEQGDGLYRANDIAVLRMLQMDGMPHVARKDFYESMLTLFETARASLGYDPITTWLAAHPEKRVGRYIPAGPISRIDSVDVHRDKNPKYSKVQEQL